MSFFGSETNEIEQLIHASTDEMLLGADWAANMQVVDTILRDPTMAPVAVEAIRKRLSNRNPKIVLLTLTLLETCMKNCSFEFHSRVGTPKFMEKMQEIAEKDLSSEVTDKCLSMIQSWSYAFSRMERECPGFKHAYTQLRAKGVNFPPLEEDSPIFTPNPRNTVDSQDYSYSGSEFDNFQDSHAHDIEAETQKLEADLDEVRERITVFTELITQSPRSIFEASVDDVCFDMWDFLDQCRPRFFALIEAGALGKLDEDLLESCLDVNDQLNKAMELFTKARNGEDIEIAQENQENSPLLDLDPFTQLSNQSQAIQLNDTEDDPFLDIALRSNRPTQGKIVIPSTLPNTQTRQNFSLPTDNYSAPVQYPSAPFYPESSTESPAFAQPDVISTPVSYTSPQEQSSYSPSMSISSTNIPTSDPFPQMLITGPVNTAPADVSFESSTENLPLYPATSQSQDHQPANTEAINPFDEDDFDTFLRERANK